MTDEELLAPPPPLTPDQDANKLTCQTCDLRDEGVCTRSGKRCYAHFMGVPCPERKFVGQMPPASKGLNSVGISRAYVISLERTPERLDDFMHAFPTIDWLSSGLPLPAAWPATDGTKVAAPADWKGGGPAFGCWDSHRKIIQKCADEQCAGAVLVMEDDCRFVDGGVARTLDAIKAAPDDVDILFVGGQHFIEPVPIKPGIVRTRETGRTHALIVFPKFFTRYLSLTGAWRTHIDHGLQHWAKTENVRFYSVDPFAAVQGANMSTIRYRQEPSRSWDKRVKVETRDPASVPVVLLRVTHAEVDRMRHRGQVHTGYWRGGDGVDNGLRELMNKPEADRPALMASLVRVLREEAAAFKDASAGLWWPGREDEIARVLDDAKIEYTCSEPKTEQSGEEWRAARLAQPIDLGAPTVFYHIACMGNWSDVVQEQLDLLRDVGLIGPVYSAVLGTPEQAEQVKAFAVSRGIDLRVEFQAEDFKLYELPTLKLLEAWAKTAGNKTCLYFHTKGVSNTTDGIKPAWRALMQHYVIRGWRENLVKLKSNDALGVCWQDNDAPSPHFSGNFWMARAAWIRELPNLDQYQEARRGQRIAQNPWERMCAETWIGSRGFIGVDSLACRNEMIYAGRRVFDFIAEIPARYKLAVAAIFKDEADNLAEWISFHLAAGVGHFFLYDNDSSDNWRDAVSQWKDQITVVPWPGQSRQVESYNDALRRFGERADWIAFVDIDEFLFDSRNIQLTESLDQFPATTGSVGASWAVYGSSGHEHKPAGGAVSNFTWRLSSDRWEPRHVKSIVRPHAVANWSGTPHSPVLREPFVSRGVDGVEVRGDFRDIPCYEGLRINHYFTRSREEWGRKMVKGCADTYRLRTQTDFDRHDFRDVEDRSAIEYKAARARSTSSSRS